MQILYFLNHFSGSETLHHEMLMLFSGEVPNESLTLDRLPGDNEVSRIPLIPMLTVDLCRLMDSK